MGIDAADLASQDLRPGRGGVAGQPEGIGLMYDERTGQPRFWLYRYKQNKGGLPVYRAGLHTLVRNDGTNAVVWAASSLRDLSGFEHKADLQARQPDRDKTLHAIQQTTDFTGRPLPAATEVTTVSKPELIVYAGTEDAEVAPRTAIQYTAETAPSGKWHLVADANTGDILNAESLVVYANVTGTVTGNVTQGDVAMECAAELPLPFPYAEVDGQSSEAAFADATGAYSLATNASGSLNVTSLMGGQYFDVVNMAGSLDQLVSSVVAPATANFLHNAANTDATVLAQANGYANANDVRGFLLKYLPTYPTISTQTNFPVNVNLSGAQSSTCPGNAYYDGSSLNFCLGNSSYTNTSFASVSHHEYGHHIVAMGGSGQGAYGEGMSDTIAALYAGAPGSGYGFYLNQCTTPLRNADNTCQYSASSCSSCGSEIHACGQLLSGIVWSIRKGLAISTPTTYVDLINKLILSSILLHKGTTINAQIAIDLLTLDDDDGNLDNGTPHYTDICAGFSAHGLTCPAIKTDLVITPAAGLAAEGPLGGPFAPASVSYTLTNLGPAASLQYTVAPTTSAPWLTISNASGQLAINQSVQVTVAIDQTAAASLAKGTYAATIQITNVTNGVGSSTRSAQMQVGVPLPIYTETFEGGLGTFSIDSGSTNLWHVSSSCASTQSGHSTPKSLYFGIDSTCTYSNGLTDSGTATSAPVTITDTSAVKLRFNYFLATETSTYYDQATVQISVNGGAFTTVAGNGTVGTLLQSGGWKSTTVDITSLFAGLSSAQARIRVGFNTVDSVLNEYTGFLVDDVQVLAFSGTSNQAPTVNAGADQAITLPATATLAGTASDDGLPNPPGALTTTWSMVSGPGTVTFANPGALSTTASFSAAGSYTLRLTANDSALSATDDVVVTVSAGPTNQAPTVNAGADQAITLPATATLAGTASDDGLPNPPGALTTTWSMVSGPGTVTFANPGALSTTATFSAAGSYTLRLTATDSALSANDDVVVTVNPGPTNQAPTVNAGADQAITLPATATLAGTATDDGLPNPPGALTTTWSMVSGPGTVTFANPSALSTTASFSAAGSYTLRLTANDSALSATDDVVVTVSAGPTNQAPTVNAGADQSITLPATATLAGTASDDGLPNPPGALTTTWSMVSGPGTVTFANPGALSTTASFSAAGTYTLRLTASDSALSTTDDVVVTVNAGPTNQAPTVNAGADQSITLPATAALAGTASDDGLPNPPAALTTTWSKVSGPGTVTFTNASALSTTATFSAAGTYTLRLTASDSALSATDDVVITVSAGNKPCSGLCSNPVTFTINGSFQSGNLGTGAVCYETTANIYGGNCGNFVSPRTLSVNGTTEPCSGGNWSSIPAKRNGGYCIQTTAGNQPWAYFTAW